MQKYTEFVRECTTLYFRTRRAVCQSRRIVICVNIGLGGGEMCGGKKEGERTALAFDFGGGKSKVLSSLPGRNGPQRAALAFPFRGFERPENSPVGW